MTLLRSWVESANSARTDFPLNNLPYGVFSMDETAMPRCGVAIGDMILDLYKAEADGLIDVAATPVFAVPYWNDVMALGPTAWAALRAQITALLAEGATPLPAYLVAQSDVKMQMPFRVAEFTDFYAGKHHAMNVGTMLRGAENALPPNWVHIPIGYNGRASTVVVSGTDIVRPNGQTKPKDADMPVFGPSQRLDFELELGAVIGGANAMGEPVTVQRADDMIFGYVVLNDWSARDIQAWEYQPLGPFQAKAFATSISPWIVTKAALEAFRSPTPPRETPLLPYLVEPGPMLYDIHLSVEMTPENGTPTTIARTNYRDMYYSAAQQLAHHASSGCAMNVGDLIGSGTISGPEAGARGSMMELTWGGQTPLILADGSLRRFVDDGDIITLRGHAQGDGYRIGFGACQGRILPARAFPN